MSAFAVSNSESRDEQALLGAARNRDRSHHLSDCPIEVSTIADCPRTGRAAFEMCFRGGSLLGRIDLGKRIASVAPIELEDLQSLSTVHHAHLVAAARLPDRSGL